MPPHDYTFIGSGPNPHHQTLLRRILSLSVLGFFLVFLLARGIGWVADGGQLNALELEAYASGRKEMPDFGQYVHSRTLRFDEASSAQGTKRRTIFVGDIHGQSYSLLSLLNTTSYNPSSDTLIHVGDLIAKGTRVGSSQVLDYVVEHNTVGVRGNHDQKVIEWRGWQEWIVGFQDGKEWIEREEGRWRRKHGEFVGEEDEVKALRKGIEAAEIELLDDDVSAASKKEQRKQDKKFRALIPSDWKIFSEHYFLARDLTPAHYDYLRSLPLILHIPSEHAFVVHAGMLPYDITKKIDGNRQPLARLPRVRGGDVGEMREKQEVGVLERVPQNGEPWALLNMRNVLHDHSIISNTKHGRAWYSAWNQLMPKCAGYNVSSSSSSEHSVHNTKWLPCEPMSVIYGHTASRGLDIHRWTLGLDSGCVYGRRLSALVLDRDEDRRRVRREDDTEEEREDDLDEWDEEEDDGDVEDVKENGHGKVRFGDDGYGRIVSVSCHKHRQKGAGKDEDRRR
ncbi:unnamed protein product [Peniophora sp. CBMAI 1063]|nr:unnamed protein product [Peniophora sp. CBMAI 1063]